jgi:hypothetical protein
MKYDNHKKFISQLAIDTKFFFYQAFANPYSLLNQRRSQSAVRLTAQSAIRCLIAITVRDGAVTLKGSHRMGDGRIFSKNLRAFLFK